MNALFSLGFVGLVLLSNAAYAAKDLALIWKGQGACSPFCTLSAGEVANQAGYRVLYVNSKLSDYSVFDEAAVWIQPGGQSVEAANDMGPVLMARIQQFVHDGGGYVGFCAGMFLATNLIGTSGVPGLGMMPGTESEFLKNDPGPTIIQITRPNEGNEVRSVYYSGGPVIDISAEDQKLFGVKVLARYSDGTLASVSAPYGKGKVVLSGFHPEASSAWKFLRGKTDPDGSDQDIAVEMIQSAAQP